MNKSLDLVNTLNLASARLLELVPSWSTFVACLLGPESYRGAGFADDELDGAFACGLDDVPGVVVHEPL